MTNSGGKTPSSLQRCIEDLRRPLVLAARNHFGSLDPSTGFERRLLHALEALRAVVSPVPQQEERLGKLKDAFTEFSLAVLVVRQKRVLLALSLLDDIESAEQALGQTATTDQIFEDRRPLYMSVQYLPGVGPKIAELMANKGLVTVEDLLFFFPRRWEDRRYVGSISDLIPGERCQAEGAITGMSTVSFTNRRKPFEVVVQDDSGSCVLSWFHYGAKAIPKRFQVGDRIRFSGKVTYFRNKLQIVHPEILKLDAEDFFQDEHAISAIYSEIQGIPAKKLSAIVRNAVERFGKLVDDPLPQTFRTRHQLPELAEVVQTLHRPQDDMDIHVLNEGFSPQQQRLAFEELFFVQLALAQRRRKVTDSEGFAHKRLNKLATEFYRRFPYKLTTAQKRVLMEIVEDLTAPKPMNRLLQGDVGSGKTIVAFLSALLVVENGRQVALMAPTEILAEQHYRTLTSFMDIPGVRVELLTSDTVRSEKRALYEGIESGHINFVIGTHALIQRGVTFRDLGYIIIDEQHRFGVDQRLTLRTKGQHPDCLVMTATPIPRSLSLTLYGDLDISIIDELPPGRQPITTEVHWMSDWPRIERALVRELSAGRQGYVITPLISDSDKLELANAEDECERLRDALPNFTIGLLHGRMSGSDKDRVMRAFKEHAYDVLVATSVVEVGIDVPNATVLIVEHAERFGLSQLHQLRGRIGRGQHPSKCFLICEHVSEEARERLSIMEQTTDGFRIAEKDLEIRGPGDFLGTRQVGTPILKHTNLLRDQKLLEKARHAAFELIARDPQLKLEENQSILQEFQARWKDRLGFLASG